MADDAHGAGTVVLAPGYGCWGEGADGEPLVGVYVRGEEQRELAQARELTRYEALERLGEAVTIGKYGRTVLAAQAQVDVAGVPSRSSNLGIKEMEYPS